MLVFFVFVIVEFDLSDKTYILSKITTVLRSSARKIRNIERKKNVVIGFIYGD